MRRHAVLAGVVATPLLFLVLLWLLLPAPDPSAPPPAPDPGPTDEALVQARCGSCHPPVDPSALPRADWVRTMNYMATLIPDKTGTAFPRAEMDRILAYYLRRSPDRLPMLGPDPADSPLRFVREAAGTPGGHAPQVANVRIVDLFGEGRPGILACDAEAGAVSFLRRRPDGTWDETVLARTGPPARAEVFDFDGDGRLDIVVAVLGSMAPTEAKCGKVVLLRGENGSRFASTTLLEGVGRVADVRPGDFNGDGAVDFVVAVFGFIKEGRIGWLEQRPGGRFTFRPILEKPGAIHVPVADLDGDGDLDFVALVSQDSEEVVAYLNDGTGNFEERSLFRAGTPVFGSSGLQLVDLDGDGDLDLLLTNGDAFDLEEPDRTTRLRPYHGVQWLENQGGLRFAARDIGRFYGCYAAGVADLNGDGHPDLVLASFYNDWEDPSRASLLWLENDGRRRFTPHLVDRSPTELCTVAVGDLDGDGRPDVVAGVSHYHHPFARKGRIAVWRNAGKAGR